MLLLNILVAACFHSCADCSSLFPVAALKSPSAFHEQRKSLERAKVIPTAIPMSEHMGSLCMSCGVRKHLSPPCPHLASSSKALWPQTRVRASPLLQTRWGQARVHVSRSTLLQAGGLKLQRGHLSPEPGGFKTVPGLYKSLRQGSAFQ